MIRFTTDSEIIGILLILLIPLVYYGCRYLRQLQEESLTRTHTKMFAHVIKITPWIYRQIERSTESIYGSYRYRVTNGTLTPNLSTEEYADLIMEIRTHFYGSVPKCISKDMLFRYLDEHQIDILILNEFNKINGGFFKVTK